MIHDAQHTTDEYGAKRHWGHSTIDYAIHVAREAGVRQLVLFHHDPSHRDHDLDLIASASAARSARVGGPEVVTAHEGLEIEVVPALHGSDR